MTKDEALKLALEALESGVKTTANRISWVEYDSELIKKAIAAIRETLAQPAQEPLVLIQTHREGNWCDDLTCRKCYGADFRFKHQKRPWVGLTGQEKALIASVSLDVYDAVHRTDAKLKEKNTCLLYTSPSPRDLSTSRMPSSA